MYKRHWLLVTVTLFLAVMLVACGGKQAAPTQEQAAPATATEPAKPAAAPTDAPKSTAAPKATAAPTPEETDLSLQSRDAGLDKLTSYRARWSAGWKSTEAGQTKTGTWGWEEEYTTEPEKARHLHWRATDSDDPTKENTFELWQIGDTMYMKSTGDEQCIAISSEDTAKNLEQGFFSPGTLGSISDGKYVGRETVNGVPTKHYTYASRLAPAQGAGEVAGELWVAIDSGYVVKDTVTWKGGAGFLGLGGETGDGAWTWQITDANKPIEIAAPEECKAQDAGMDLPVMPDAKEKARFGGMMSYKTDSKVADVAAFYKEKLAEAGWSVEGEPTETSDVTMLNYTKDNKKLNLMITASDGPTQVVLNISE